MLVGVDAGGSRTVVMVQQDAGHVRQFEQPSISPVAVGAEAARAAVIEVFRRLAAIYDGQEVIYGCVACAWATPLNIGVVAQTLAEAAEHSRLKTKFLVAEDATVMLAGPPLSGVGILTIVGTGSITLGRSASGHRVQCGGYEYLISDEGSGFDIGMCGLRAAASAYDGRGAATQLLDAALSRYAMDLPVLGDYLGALPYPKFEVARFASDVCALAESGDQVAARIVAGATASIVRAVSATANALQETVDHVAFCGGVVAYSDYFSRQLSIGLLDLLPSVRLSVIKRPVETALSIARQMSQDRGSVIKELPHLLVSQPS